MTTTTSTRPHERSSPTGKGSWPPTRRCRPSRKRLAAHAIESTAESRRAYREMLFSTPGIIAVHRRRHPAGRDDPPERARPARRWSTLLADRGMIPGIKVDAGAHPLAGAPGELVTEGLDGLRGRLEEYRRMGARFAKWRAVFTHRRRAADREVRARQRRRARALRGALSGAGPGPDRRARGADGRRAHHRALRRGDRARAARGLRRALRRRTCASKGCCSSRTWCIAGQRLRDAGLGRGGGGGDPAHAAPARAAGRSRDRLSVGRAGSPAGDRAPRRDQSARRAEAVDAQLLLRSRAAGRGAGDLARPERERRGGSARLLSPRQVRQRRRARPLRQRRGSEPAP